ncbi:heavy metal-associated isoprenylated plant protein 6-like [Arachis stenosperma]|uniref:heavy metal-associated isoprenylated plant protein 6-like n=1 Tax=Arachis stenosperma TaxID=217475 RepID=UPI0025ACDC22|nr:heavy metal-associated isoprenylated plant protein 6-like [Arachis stenosperma]
MAEKVTVMKLKVDLECHKCYKKVKKVLAKFPQIRDEKFDEKQNVVTITVVCCSPEKIRDKLCYKGGGSIKSIEIVDPPKPEKKKDADDKPKAPAPDPPKKKDAAADKPKPKPAAEPDKKKDAGDKAEKPKDAAPKEKTDKPKGDSEKPKGDPEKPKDKPAEAKPAPPPVKIADPVAAYPPAPQPMMVPVGICVTGYEGGPGPCVNGYAGPVMCYDGYYARPVYDSYGGGRPYYVNRCDQYFSDENQAGCTVM